MTKKISLVFVVMAVLFTAKVAFADPSWLPVYNYLGYNNVWGPSPGQPYSTAIATLESEDSGYAGINEFGYYAMDDRSVLYPIFKGFDSAGTVVEFPQLTVDFAFYLKNNEGTWFSWRIPSDPPDDVYEQHFVRYWESGDVMWLGMDDVAFTNGSDKDYNDMIVKVDFTGTPVATPEPATLLLFGLGLMGLAGVRRKIKN